jgi:signal transduction histidine kinase
MDGAYTHDELVSLAARDPQEGKALPRGGPALVETPLDAAWPSPLERGLLDLLPVAVVAVGHNLTVTAANREADRLLHLGARDSCVALPEPWAELSLRRFARGLCEPGALPAEVRVQVDGGRVVELIGTPHASGALVVIRDVSARSRRDEAERAFVINAAHELRASLGGISSAVEALELGATEDPRHRDRLLGGLAQEVRRLRDDVEGLLVLSRAHADGRPVALEPVAVAPLLDQVVAAISLQTGVAVETSCDPTASVRGTRALLDVALSNVARNAARHARSEPVSVSCRRSTADRVAIEVTDDGRGIATAARERPFERFSEAGAGGDGFGIGLSLTRDIVMLLGGDVELESDERGTTVRLLLRSA